MMGKNYRKAGLFLFLSFILIGLMGCSKEVNISKEVSISYDNESDITTLRERELSDVIEALNLPYEMRTALSVVYDLEDLKSDGIVDIVRYNKDKDMFYSVTHVEGGRYLLLLYEPHKKGYHVVDGFLVSTLANKASFENISKGMKREEIIKNDPSACVFENRSYHRFSDKSILRIDYTLEDGQYIVSDFQYLEDQVFVLDYLLPKDSEIILQE